MGMGVERRAEAVHEGDRAHPGIGGRRFAVQMPAQPLGQRHAPLAHRHRRNRMIHQVGGGLGHAPRV
jgi:hypothetical protein